MAEAAKILVTDFDGTITAQDFYLLAVQRLLHPEDLRYWDDYRAGRISHFTALQSIFGEIRASEQELDRILQDMRPDPDLRESIAALRNDGWEVVVASAGCAWYIDRILAGLGVSLEVHANPGTCPEGGPLIMKPPLDDPFYCKENGVDKAAIVRFHQERGALVAYAGDGYTDLPAALLVAPERRFARADLAGALAEKKEPFRPFSRWSEMASALLQQKGTQ